MSSGPNVGLHFLDPTGAARTMATYTAHLFTTLDGFGTGRVGYWGKDGPELREYQDRTFFAGEGQTLVFGANTYRLMEGLVTTHDGPGFRSLNASPKVVISRTLEEPLGMENTTL